MTTARESLNPKPWELHVKDWYRDIGQVHAIHPFFNAGVHVRDPGSS